MRILMIAFGLLAAGCGDETKCNVQVEANGDALITCPDGTSALIQSDHVTCDVLDVR